MANEYAHPEYLVDTAWVDSHLSDSSVRVVESDEDYLLYETGHIPGAVNFDWVNAIDRAHSLRLKPTADLKQALSLLGVTPDKEVITYCHTHHRSAHTYLVLKNLGYSRVRGYPGSWSEWGNSADTPVE